MAGTFKLVVLTRVNIGFRDGQTVAGHKVDHAEWLRARLDLFDRFTLPSMLAQTERRFSWLLCFSPETPESMLPRVMGYQRDERIRVVFSHRGCDPGVDPLTRLKGDGRRVAVHTHMPVEPIRVIEDDLARDPVDWVVTMRVDSDDVVAADLLNVVYKAQKAHHFISAPHGYVYDAATRQVWQKDSLHNAWLSLVEPGVPGRIWTVWCVPHVNPSVEYAKLTGLSIPVITRGYDRRRWVAVRHSDNSTPLHRGDEVSVSTLTQDPLFAAVRW